MFIAQAQQSLQSFSYYLTAVGMGVVFFGLGSLIFIMTLVIKLYGSMKERENRKQILRKISNLAMRRATVEIPYGPENTADVNDEVVAAISLALNMYFMHYESPDNMATITKIMKISPSSPWKIYYRTNAVNRHTNRNIR